MQSGEFPAGMHLSEISLSARFEVSRTPIRAALKILAKHKLISRRDPAGFVVRADAAKAKVPHLATTVPTTQELYRTLVDARARRLLPELLTERELLTRFPVRRSVLLKTLAQMTSVGLIEKRRGHGWRFLPSLGTREGIIESYNFRLVVEPNGFLQPTFKCDKDELQRSRAVHEQFLQNPTADQKIPEFRDLNSAFHEMLARFSGNRFFLQVVQQQNQLRRLEEHADFFRHLRIRESCQEHLGIIGAIDAGDLEWAAALMRRHLAVARDVS
jgi:DNA-binding GntR family transcriptional regulator